MSNYTTKYYTFEELQVTVAGVSVHEFAGDTDSITVQYVEKERFTDTSGTNGDVVINEILDKRGEIGLQFLQTSASNQFFSGILNAQMNGAFTTFPVEIKDLNGTSIYTGAKCWIPNMPDVAYGKEVAQRNWQIKCTKLIANVGSQEEL